MKRLLVSLIFLCLVFVEVHPIHAQETQEDSGVFQRATQAFQQENYRQSLRLYQRFIRNKPNDSRYWDAKFGAAQSHFKLNNFDRANKTFAAVRKNHSDKTVRGDALFGQIQVAILQDNVALARTLSQTFLDIHTNHILRSSVERQLDLLDDMDVQTESRTKQPDTSDSVRDETSPPPSDRSPAETETESGSNMDAQQSDEQANEDSRESMVPELRFGSSSSADEEQDQSRDGEDRSRDGDRDLDGDTGESSRVQLIRSLRDRLNNRNQTLDQLRARVEELRQDNNELDSRVQSLTETNRRLKNQLSRKITELANDTELHQLSRSVNLPDTANKILQSSLSDIRRRAKSDYDSGRLERANRRINKVLERNPRPSDHYLAAQIARDMGRTDRALRQLTQAIERSDKPSISYLAEKAEILFERENSDALDQFIRRYSDTVQSRSQKPASARWYLLLGRRDLRRNRPDQAFFHLMQAIRTSPESTWAEQAQTLIQNEL